MQCIPPKGAFYVCNVFYIARLATDGGGERLSKSSVT